MVLVKPIVLNTNGTKKEIGSTEIIPIGNLAEGTPDGTKFIRDDNTLASISLPVFEIEIDFGLKPVRSKRFVISQSLLLPTNKIIVNPSGNVATGRGIDDWEWDTIQFAAKSLTNEWILYAYSNTRIGGKRKIYFTIN